MFLEAPGGGVRILDSLTIELLGGKSPIDARSFGRVFRAVTSRSFPRLAELAPQASKQLVDLVDAMLALNPAARPTAGAIVHALG